MEAARLGGRLPLLGRREEERGNHLYAKQKLIVKMLASSNGVDIRAVRLGSWGCSLGRGQSMWIM